MSKNTITVYAAPSCPQCRLTYIELEKAGLTFNTVDLSQDEAAVEMVKTLGYLQAPVVVTEDDHWSGFRPDKISELTHPNGENQ